MSYRKNVNKYLRHILGFALLVSVFNAKAVDITSHQCHIKYWVSLNGNDETGNGSQKSPFKTIDKARLELRKEKNNCDITVEIEGGTYNLNKPLIFDNADSGSPQHPIIYEGNPNSTPVIISGGVKVQNFTCRGNICTAKVPYISPDIMPRQFYVNGERAIRARSQDNFKNRINYIRQKNGYAEVIPQKFSHPELLEAVTIAQWKMMRCPVLTDKKPAHILIMQNPCWKNANTYKKPWDFRNLSWLENAPEFLNSPQAGNMWFYNPYTQEMSYNKGNLTSSLTGVVPQLENLLLIAGTSKAPVSNIIFKNLTFSYATWLLPNSKYGYVSDQSGNMLIGNNYKTTAIGHQKNVYKTPGNISLKYAHNITFIGNKFTHLGAVALDLGTGSQNNQVINNVFTDISSSAIQIGGVKEYDMRPNKIQTTANNLVKNNFISYTGQDYSDSAAIHIGFTTGTLILHNTISHVPWSGISIGWGWGLVDKPSFPGLPKATPYMWGKYSTPTINSNNKIVANKIEYFLEKQWDGGAIYTNGAQGQNFANGLLIQLNVATNKRSDAAGVIYYTDGGSRYVTLDRNVSLNNPRGKLDFGPCISGSGMWFLCTLSDIVPFGADIGGCLPAGDLAYYENYLEDPKHFFGSSICKNKYAPNKPVNLKFNKNIETESASSIPSSILEEAGQH